MVYQTTAIIRQRGQLTVPEEVRKVFNWATNNSVVSINITADGFFVAPFAVKVQKKTDWASIWNRMQIADSFKGKPGSMSQFIVDDRDSRR